MRCHGALLRLALVCCTLVASSALVLAAPPPPSTGNATAAKPPPFDLQETSTQLFLDIAGARRERSDAREGFRCCAPSAARSPRPCSSATADPDAYRLQSLCWYAASLASCSRLSDSLP